MNYPTMTKTYAYESLPTANTSQPLIVNMQFGPSETTAKIFLGLDLQKKIMEDGDCLVWLGGCCNGHPAARFNAKTMLVRRVLWAELHGEIEPGRIVRMTCNTPKCVNPEHTELTTYKRLAKKLGALGVMSGPVRSAAIARTKRVTQGKLNDAAVKDIRSSNEPGHVLAERYGVTQAHIRKVQLHKAWRNFSSPFNGLGARA